MNMGNTFKRFLAFVLAFAMVFAYVPTNAFATEAESEPVVEVTNVAEVNGTKYESLQAAVEAAEDGATITVIADHEMDCGNLVTNSGGYSALVNVAGKAVTIDLNGKTITVSPKAAQFVEAKDTMLMGVFAVDTNGTLTLKDSIGTGNVVVTANDAKVYSLAICYGEGGKLNFESGSYTADAVSSALIYSQYDEVVTVYNGNFRLGNVGTLSNGSPWIFNASGQNTRNIIVVGGTYNADIFHQHYIFEVKDTTEVAELLGVPVKAAKNNGDGTWTVVDAVAYVDEQHKSGNWYTQYTGYATLDEAITAAEESKRPDYTETVTLIGDSKLNADVTVKSPIRIEPGVNVTLDLDGHTITGESVYPVIRIDGDASLTVKNGSIVNDDYVFVLGASDGSSAGNLTIESGSYTGNVTVASVTKGKLTINGGEFSVTESEYGATYLLNCIDANYKDGSAKIVVTGGTFKGFNPAANAAEGTGTNFVPEGYVSETKDEGATYTVRALKYVAQVGETKYESLKEAVEAANGATVTLLKDVTLGEKLTISGNVTISGAYTITLDAAYTGTLFFIDEGKALTLDGGLVIDGGNAWVYTKTPLEMDMANGAGTKVADHITPAEGGVNATAALIVNNGTLNANKVTIQNSYSTAAVSAISCGAESVTTLDGATLKNIAANQSGAVLKVLGEYAVLTIKGDTRITGNFGIGNGGIIQNYGQGTTVNLEGGSIDNNHVGSSGTLYASHSGNANKINTFNMSGGIITQNIMEGYGPIYIHTNTVWNMTGGEISENTSYLPSYVRNNNPAGIMSGGKIVNNVITGADYSGDYYVTRYNLRLNGKTAITGGEFTQDVSEWLAPNTGLVYDETTGVYTVTDHVYNLYFRDPATGEQVVGVGPLQGNNLAELIATGKLFYADYYKMELEVLCNVKIDETVVIDYPMTINLNGKTISAASAIQSSPVIRVLADVTVTGEGKIDGRGGESCYAFIVGNSETAGNLTIENGTFYGDTTAVSVTKGVLTINGGKFAVNPYQVEGQEDNYNFLLNCIDANYKDGSAVIEVKGGTFYKFNPAANAAEGTGTNFVAEGYEVVADGEYYTVSKVKNYIAQVGDVKYESLKEALEACTNGETVKLLTDIIYDADDVVYAHGGATGFGDYDQYNPSIIYIGGTKGATAAENQPSNVNAVLDLNGHTITNNADAYLFLFMDNCKVKFVDSENGKGIIGNTNMPVIWVTGTDTLVTIDSGKYTTVNAEGLIWATHSGDLVINGGEFSTTAEDASLLILRNEHDRRNSKYFISGKSTVTVTGGTFHGFNPEKMLDDSTTPFTEFNAVAEGYAAIENNGVWTVSNYIKWIKAELLAGRSVTLDRDIVVDGSYIESIPAPTNSNGKYPNYGIFNVVGDYDVTFDLNGHTITYNGHADFQWNGKTYNSCTVAHGLFFANAGADLTVIDSSKDQTGTVMVYGLASGAYVASPNTTFTITGGTWKNVGCATCGGTNIFLYPLQGGELYITGGTFEQALDADGNSYLLVNGNGEYKNSVIDYSKTKLVITGGTFVGMNPEEARLFYTDADNKTNYDGFTNACDKGYKSEDNGDGTWTVVPNMIFELHLTDANGEAHWLSPMSGNDLNSLLKDGKIWYDSLQGTYDFTLKILESYELDETVVVNFPLTIDLGGNTITVSESMSATPAFRILTDVTVTNGTVDATAGTSTYAFIVGNSTTAGTLTIVDGTYKGCVSVASVTQGALNVEGGYFEGTEYEGAHEFTLNCIDANYKDGSAKIVVTGGTFKGFNPENNAAEGKDTNFLTKEYTAAYDKANDSYTVMTYVAWVKAELLAGNDVTLDRDIVLNDISYVTSEIALSNGNGNYCGFDFGNGAFFNVIGGDVTFDLNGHSITYDIHDTAWCNKRVVSIFYATDKANLNVIDSAGTGEVTVNGMATAAYSVAAGTKVTISGGTWTWNPCKTCDAANVFLYASHGGELYITGGNFINNVEGVSGEYMIMSHYSSKETTENWAGVDYDSTKIEISGGTFQDYNPEKIKYMDNGNGNAEKMDNAVAEGYEAVDNGDGTWTVVEKKDDVHITINTDNMTLGNSLAINFWVYKNQMREGVEYTAKLIRTYADGSTETLLVPMSDWVEYGTYYQVVYDQFAAKEMTDTVSIEILMPDGTSASNVFTDSIKEYAMFMLGYTADAELKTALVDMLNYGTAAQKEFGYKTDNMANADLTDAQKQLATQSIDPKDVWTSTGTGYASNLELVDNIILRLWFKDVTEGMYAEVEFENHYGEKVTTTVTFDEFMLHNANGNVYSVPVDELVIADGASVVTCTLFDANGNEVGTITESVGSYIAFMLSQDSDTNGLYEATMKFVTSAHNLFH